MAELAAVRPGRHVGDDVELLAGLQKGGLERHVVARRDDQLVRQPAFPQERRQRGEKAVDLGRARRLRLEEGVELVVQRSRAAHDGDVLGDPRQARAVLGVVETLRETRGEIRDVGAKHRDKPSFEERAHHLVEVAFRHGRGIGRLQRRVLPQDRAVQLLQLATRIDSELLDEEPTSLLVCVQRLGLTA